MGVSCRAQDGVLGEGAVFLPPHSSYTEQLRDEDFVRLSKFIYSVAGIKLPPAKRIMLQSRLQRRLRALEIPDFKQYTDYVLSPQGQQAELVHMLDVVSTNKTDFFREPIHFDFLREQVLPAFCAEGQSRTLKVWSAGCSSGEEPYTIAIVLAEFFESHVGFDFSILATDLSTRVLAAAHNAVYKEERVEGIPFELKRKYFLRSKDRSKPTVRVVPALRKKVRFERLNFMDESYRVADMFDVIFCRNVLIYFDRKTQEQVIQRLCTKLKPHGNFFLGHSESVMNMHLPLRQLKPTIFEKLE